MSTIERGPNTALGYPENSPVHPWIAERGMQFPDVSPLWLTGENPAADAIIFNDNCPEVLLIQRRDGSWANAGGFVDAADANKAVAAAREAREEAGVNLDPDEAQLVYEGVVHDIRSGKYKWMTTAAYLWRTSLNLDNLAAGDDATSIRLADLAQVRAEPLYGSHSTLIETAVNLYGTTTEKLRYYADLVEHIPTWGGHMNYQRFVAKLPSGEKVFVKEFAPEQFTDTAKKERSKLYLEREHEVYRYLSTANFSAAPGHADYCDGTLVMDALSAEDGWLWRHPSDTALRQRYITDVLTASDELARIPVIPPHEAIMPSYISFHDEGWGSYEDSKDKVTAKLQDFAASASTSDATTVRRLIDNLDTLAATTHAASPDDLMVMSHHDFRESNIAWHPDFGAKIVDWSWAGPGPRHADATMFLIDLHKRGVTVDEHMAYFNPDHALTILGFWLLHSTWEGGSTTVREEQIRSALAAYELLEKTIFRDNEA